MFYYAERHYYAKPSQHKHNKMVRIMKTELKEDDCS